VVVEATLRKAGMLHQFAQYVKRALLIE
jgi:hypothetical protein